jgi:hypothetical protein
MGKNKKKTNLRSLIKPTLEFIRKHAFNLFAIPAVPFAASAIYNYGLASRDGGPTILLCLNCVISIFIIFSTTFTTVYLITYTYRNISGKDIINAGEAISLSLKKYLPFIITSLMWTVPITVVSIIASLATSFILGITAILQFTNPLHFVILFVSIFFLIMLLFTRKYYFCNFITVLTDIKYGKALSKSIEFFKKNRYEVTMIFLFQFILSILINVIQAYYRGSTIITLTTLMLSFGFSIFWSVFTTIYFIRTYEDKF